MSDASLYVIEYGWLPTMDWLEAFEHQLISFSDEQL
jgi:hypothetical protein